MFFYRKVSVALYNLLNLDRVLDVVTREHSLLRSALYSKEPLVSKKSDAAKEIIVSLTSYSYRVIDVHLVIESLGMQSIKANKIILWLDEEEYDDASLPELIKNQIKRGLNVNYCKNYKSYKKLIPTLMKYPISDVITVDDDILYPFDLIEQFVKLNVQFPNTVICNRFRNIETDREGKLLPYNKWSNNVQSLDSAFRMMPTGVGGVFYPQGCFSKQVLDVDMFQRLAPNADDLWFKFMALLKGTETITTFRMRKFHDEFLSVRGSQSVGLFKTNVGDNQNDLQLAKLMGEFESQLPKAFK